jgi:hypothetical protein
MTPKDAFLPWLRIAWETVKLGGFTLAGHSKREILRDRFESNDD